MAAGIAELFQKESPGGFKRTPFYERNTDSIIYYARDEKSYAVRLNSELTLFLSRSNRTLVGCEIKGVTRLCRHLGTFNVFVRDHRIDLSILIAVATYRADGDQRSQEALSHTISELGKMTQDVSIELTQFATAG